jgi:MYXO-CTERM domain-containing protein
VFTRSSTTWTEQQELLASDGAADDHFGYSVSVSEDTAVVGARDKASYQGAAYVFARSGTTWTEQQKLLASDGAADDNFGYSVAVSGDTAVVGAISKASGQGAAYVFAPPLSTSTSSSSSSSGGGGGGGGAAPGAGGSGAGSSAGGCACATRPEGDRRAVWLALGLALAARQRRGTARANAEARKR